MSRKYFFRRGDLVSGPVTPQQLLQMVADDTLRKSDYVRVADQKSWHIAGQVKGLFPKIPDTVLGSHPICASPPVPASDKDSSATPALATSGRADFEGYERDRRQRRAARRKRLALWGGAAAIIATIGVIVTTPLLHSTGVAKRGSGIGWSLADVQQRWGEAEGWDWYYTEPALSGESGVIDCRARRADGRTEELQVVGLLDGLRSFNVSSSIEPREDALKPTRLATWSLSATTMVAEVADANPNDVANWFVTIFWQFVERVADHHETAHSESREFGGAEVSVLFILTKTGIFSSVGVSSLDKASTTETARQQQDHANEPKLPKSLVDRISAIGDPALSESTRDKWLTETNSSRDHWNRMTRFGERMIKLGYDITLQRLPYLIAGWASNIKVADSYTYEMEWRLNGVGDHGVNDVPVCFLKTRYDGPITHEMAIAAVQEFERISRGSIILSKVTTAMKDAETRFRRIRLLKPSDWNSWFVASKLPEKASLGSPEGDYVIRVSIAEWQREEYTLEKGASKILIYFVYLPPNRRVDLTKIDGAGFRPMKAPGWWSANP